MKRKTDESEREPMLVSQAMKPSNLFEWVLLALIVGLAGATAFVAGLLAGGYIW